jgi:hypothetical protein
MVLGIAGSLYYQSARIHHFHQLYDQANVTIALKDQQIKDMTTAQNDQLKRSDQAVIKVVQGPREVQSIIEKVQSAPAKPCVPPTYPDEVKNAF